MGANDPIYVANEPMSDLLVAAVTATIGETLADRSGGSILANPILGASFIGRDAFNKAIGGSAVDIAWGVDKLVATAEGTNATVLDLASDKATVTAARFAIARVASDRARALDSWGVLQWASFARDCTIGWQQTMVSTIAALATSVTATGGNSGGAATWGHIRAAAGQLDIANAGGMYVLITRPKDWDNIEDDALSLGGRVQHQTETDQYMNGASNGFRGMYLNGRLAVYCTDEIPTSGGDDVSMMFGMNALIWNAYMAAPSPSTTPILWTPLYGAELDRTGLKNEDNIIYSSQLGASLRQNAAAIKLPFLT